VEAAEIRGDGEDKKEMIRVKKRMKSQKVRLKQQGLEEKVKIRKRW
jgi:hypothetical protein